MVQVLHRARPFELVEQLRLGSGDRRRRDVRLVLHTSHPVPGLRVDELYTYGGGQDVNERRAAEAEAKIVATDRRLRLAGANSDLRLCFMVYPGIRME